MAFGVVLDTCVLYPLSIADILMRLAERELYDLFWSERILKDLERVMQENGASAKQAAYRVDAYAAHLRSRDCVGGSHC